MEETLVFKVVCCCCCFVVVVVVLCVYVCVCVTDYTQTDITGENEFLKQNHLDIFILKMSAPFILISVTYTFFL